MGRGRSGSNSSSGVKAGSALAEKAKSQSWEDFRAGMRDRETVELMKANGIRSPKEMRQYWVQERLASFGASDAHEVPLEDAIATVNENISASAMHGWFVEADSDYKEKIETAVLGNNDVRNAGLVIAYHNYKDMTGSNLSFDDYVKKPLTLYRGDRGQQTVAGDVFKSYTTDKAVAESFGGNISKISVRPIDTLGSYQTTGEAEYLVPRR